jgi:hypothetical protein
MKWMIGVLVIIFVGAGVFSIPIWKKNSFAIKQRTKRELLYKKKELIQNNVFLDQQIHELSDLDRIETIASRSLNLSWGERPIEVEF